MDNDNDNQDLLTLEQELEEHFNKLPEDEAVNPMTPATVVNLDFRPPKLKSVDSQDASGDVDG